MSDLSFGLKTSKDFLVKLLDEYGEFLNDRTSSSIAINCAMTAWHLTDWVYHEFKSKEYAQIKDYRNYIKTQCKEMEIMQDITNGSKHYLITFYDSKIETTYKHAGAFSSGFSFGFDVSSLDIKMKDGRKLYFEQAMKKVINFWKDYFKNELLIS